LGQAAVEFGESQFDKISLECGGQFGQVAEARIWCEESPFAFMTFASSVIFELLVMTLSVGITVRPT
jgi:hypothetical protein